MDAVYRLLLHRAPAQAQKLLRPTPPCSSTFSLTGNCCYYPPYHSKYNPIERCWGILELHGNGTQLRTVDTMLEWAKRMTWKGIKPVVELSRKVYAKGVTLSKTAMQALEARLERNPLLPKWDILIHPARAT
jgi:hypothetical protein